MDIVRSILQFLGRHRADAMPVSIEDSPIHKLPSELITLIASYLPLESVASLSLSCHSFHSCLEAKCLHALKKAGYSAVNGFLRLLERDLPAHILCSHCNKFHSMTLAEQHLPSRINSQTDKPWLACWTADLESDVKRGIYLEFSSTIFRMAMKAHRHGHNTDKLLSLLSYGTRNIVHAGFVEQYSVVVRIQAGSLLVREQRVFMVPYSQKIPLPWNGGIDVCPHIQIATMSGLHMLGIEIPYADEIEGYENGQGIIYCEHCYIEFRTDFKSYGKLGNALFVTKWMNIGEGRDLSDHMWRSRLGCFHEKTWTKVAFRRGSICVVFEQKADFRFDSLLTRQDEKDLCKRALGRGQKV